MSINVKRVKRVRETRNALQLTRDLDQYIDGATTETYTDFSEVNLSFTFSTNDTSLAQIPFILWNDNTNYLRFQISNGRLSGQRILDGSFTNIFTNSLSIESGVEYECIATGGVFTVNGNPVSINPSNTGLNLVNPNFTISKYGYATNGHLDGKIFGWSIEGEDFNLKTIGSNVVGSNGTVATLYNNPSFVNVGDKVKEFNVGTNKPAFRQNGYQLEFDSSNSDYIESPFIALNQFSDLSFSVKGEFAPNGASQQIFSYGNPSSSTGSYSLFITNVGQVFFQCFNTSSTRFVNQLIETISGTVTKEYSFDGTFFYIDGIQSFDFSASASELMAPSVGALPRIGIYYNNTRPFNGIIYECSVQNETFNPQDIDSNAQIEGSSGTIAQVNTSAAGGTSYILGTVFQKSSFALEFDSSNDERLYLPTTGVWVNTSDIDFEATFEYTNFVNVQVPTEFGSVNQPLSGGVKILTQASSGFSGVYLSLEGSANDYSVLFGSLSIGTIYTVKVFNREVYLDGVLKGTLTEDVVNIDLENFARGVSSGSNIILYNIKANGVNYPLTEGLGAETDGAQIITSAADSNERINFGMWQKNGNVLGFDSANSEYIDVNQDLSAITDLSQLNFSVRYSTQNLTQTQQVFSILAVSNGGWISLEQGSTGLLFFLVRDNTGTQIFTKNLGTRTLNEVYEVVFNGTELFINGSLKYTVTSPETINLNLTGANIQLNAYQIGRHGDQTYFDFSLDGKTFQFREGSGATTTSEDETTTATINTSHAGGIEDSNIWQESKDKWLNYKKQ